MTRVMNKKAERQILSTCAKKNIECLTDIFRADVQGGIRIGFI